MEELQSYLDEEEAIHSIPIFFLSNTLVGPNQLYELFTLLLLHFTSMRRITSIRFTYRIRIRKSMHLQKKRSKEKIEQTPNTFSSLKALVMNAL